MASVLKLRRGTTATHSSFIGSEGEITYNTDTNELVTHDGTTVGGFSGGGYMPGVAGAVPSSVQAKLREFVSALDAGAKGDGVLDDTQAMVHAAENKLFSLGSASYRVSSLSVVDGVKSDGATILLSGHHNNITETLFKGEIIGTLVISGDVPVTVGITAASIYYSGTFDVKYYAGDIRAAKYQLVDLTLNASVAVGNMLLVTADQPELSGCFEVISKTSTNVARVLMLAQGLLDVTSFTGSAKVLTTVLQFSNIRMIDVSVGNLILQNIGFIGVCYPITNGTRSNLYDPAGSLFGVTGIVSRNGGLIRGIDCGVSGVSGTQISAVDCGTIDWSGSFVSCGGRNGFAASYGKGVFGSACASQNLLDNIIGQDQSFIYAVGAKSCHGGRNGVVTSSGATVNATSAKLNFNGFLDPANGNGAAALSANLTAIGAVCINNAQSGINAIGNSDVRATGLTAQNNTYGVACETSSHAIITGIVNSNTVKDLYAITGGRIDAIGATYSTSRPAAGVMDGAGSLVQSSISAEVLATSGTYTPTLTNVTNIISSTPAVCQYIQVNKVVTVSGVVFITPAAIGRITMRMTLPVTSNFSSIRHAGGTFAASSVSASSGGSIYPDVANLALGFDGVISTTGNTACHFTVTYLVV